MNENFEKWIEAEKQDIKFYANNIKETDNGLKFNDDFGVEMIVEWKEELYNLLSNEFNDCEYLYTYFYHDSPNDYFVNFKYNNHFFSLTLRKDESKFVIDTMVDMKYNFDSLSDELLLNIKNRFQLIIQAILNLSELRLKFLFHQEEKSRLENLKETAIEKEIIKRKELKNK